MSDFDLPLAAQDAKPDFRDASGCAAWLKELPLINVAPSHGKLLAQLVELNRSDIVPAERLKIAELLREAVVFLQTEQEKKFSNRPVPVLAQEREIFTGVVALWDAFLRGYLETFRFQSVTTQDFLDFLEVRLPGLAARAGALAFVDGTGLPAGASTPRSARAEQLRSGTADPANPTELLVYLQGLSPKAVDLGEIDRRFGISTRRSLELRHSFVLLQLKSGAPGAVEAARRVVLETGRMRYLRPIYTELARRDPTAAGRIYAEAQGGYHAIARSVVESVLKEHGALR